MKSGGQITPLNLTSSTSHTCDPGHDSKQEEVKQEY